MNVYLTVNNGRRQEEKIRRDDGGRREEGYRERKSWNVREWKGER